MRPRRAFPIYLSGFRIGCQVADHFRDFGFIFEFLNTLIVVRHGSHQVGNLTYAVFRVESDARLTAP